MVGLTGLDLARWARRKFPDLPVIAISGFITDESDGMYQSVLEAGVAAILGKPFTPADLMQAIETVVGE
jgi:CheY-like chemotaxis protein